MIHLLGVKGPEYILGDFRGLFFQKFWFFGVAFYPVGVEFDSSAG
jgi:hypothetical protein